MPLHPELAAGRWLTLSLDEQLGNVGSEVSRARRWRMRNSRLSDAAIARALELLDLTIEDSRRSEQRGELIQVRGLLCDARNASPAQDTQLAALDRYFYPFAVRARA